VNNSSVVLQQGRKPHWVSSRLGSIISQHLFQGTRHTLSWKTKERNAPVVKTFLPSSLVAYRDNHLNLTIFWGPYSALGYLTGTS